MIQKLLSIFQNSFKGPRTPITILSLSVLGTLTIGSVAYGFPHPTSGSSLFLDFHSSQFHSKHGFVLSSGKTKWLHKRGPENHPYIETVFRAPYLNYGVQAALTVRTDILKSRLSLKTYVNRWKKDYTRFGFEVLAARPIRLRSKKAFLIDLINRESKKQLRQVVFLRKKVAVTLTCRDHRKSFRKTVKYCNHIIKSFKWETPSPPP